MGDGDDLVGADERTGMTRRGGLATAVGGVETVAVCCCSPDRFSSLNIFLRVINGKKELGRGGLNENKCIYNTNVDKVKTDKGKVLREI